MAKCGACGKFLSPTEAARCDKCSCVYHRACVGVPAKGALNSPWHCPECKKNVARDNHADTPVRGSMQAAQEKSYNNQALASPTATDNQVFNIQELELNIRAELKLFKEEFMNSMRQEFQLLREDIVELRSSVSACSDRMTNLEARVIALEGRQAQPPASLNNLEQTIAQLKADINDREQELLLNDVEIANLPEISGENTINTVLLVASKIGVSIEARDIVSAERVGRRINATDPIPEQSTRPRHLVVRLTRRHLRDEMLQASRVRRGANTADLGMSGPPVRFYINERLTKHNRQLFRTARETGNRLGWRFIWSQRGRILARNKPGDSACLIRCEADLQRVFGTTQLPVSEPASEKDSN